MAASTESELNRTLRAAMDARRSLHTQMVVERERTVDFLDVATSAGWSWDRIGRALDMTGTAARRYYLRNRRKVHGGE